jgi:hypothetical protein
MVLIQVKSATPTVDIKKSRAEIWRALCNFKANGVNQQPEGNLP